MSIKFISVELRTRLKIKKGSVIKRIFKTLLAFSIFSLLKLVAFWVLLHVYTGIRTCQVKFFISPNKHTHPCVI